MDARKALESKYCFNCMRERTRGNSCPMCGSVWKPRSSVSYALSMGTIIKDRYLLGKAEERNNGVLVYVGRDLSSDTRVAITEYCPLRVFKSDKNTEKQTNESSIKDVLARGRRSELLKEHTGIVKVLDCFEWQESAYIVTEPLDGELLSNTKITANEIFAHLEPVLSVLEDIHRRGWVHGEINPDNILVSVNGELKLLDCGAFYDCDKNSGQYMGKLAKTNFTPIELYKTADNIGPWTDIYSLCASIYSYLAKAAIPASADHSDADIERSLTELKIPISEAQRTAILKGMSVRPEGRFKGLNEFIEAINGKTSVTHHTKSGNVISKEALSKWIKGNRAKVLAAILGVAVLIGTIYFISNIDTKKEVDLSEIIEGNRETMADEIESDELESDGISTLRSNLELRNYFNKDTRRIVFGKRKDYPFSNIVGIAVDNEGDGSIQLFIDGETLYVLSDNVIRFNEASTFLFADDIDAPRIEEIQFDNIDTSNVNSMSGLFFCCEYLKSLDLSLFDTSKATKMEMMFYNCKKLQSLDLSTFDTSNVTDMNEMFYECENMENLNLGSFDTSNVTDMSGMFSYCIKLKELKLGSFDTSNVTKMNWMFNHCEVLRSIDLSSFDTSQVTDMSYMFNYCEALRSLDVSRFDTFKVTDMSEMFSCCSCLESLDLSSFNTSNVTEMGWMFSQCESLQSLNLSSFDTSYVTVMSYMFSNCRALEFLDVSCFNTSQVTNMNGMFSRCSRLESRDLSSFDTSNVEEYENMFSGCSTTCRVKVNNSFWTLGTSEDVAIGEQ